MNVLPAINPALRRSYDLRGVVGETLGSGDAYAVGRAFATLATSRRAPRIAVTRDGRESSPELEDALVRGLVDGGLHVFRMPLGPTPLLYFAIHTRQLDGGIAVTGSHNPPDQNGFKLWLAGQPLSGDALGALWETDGRARPGGTVEELDVSAAWLDALHAILEGLAPPSCAWDCGNGATGMVVERLLRGLGSSQWGLFTTVDGSFPHHHPDPSVDANLETLGMVVRGNALQLGIAFDGDGDRIGVVDSTGTVVRPDQLLLLLARDVLAENPGATIVADVKSSQTLFTGIAALGGRAVMAPSGYVRVRERMLGERAPLAGEMSGHIFFGDRWHHADDAVYVAVRLLRALARSSVSLKRFREQLPPTFATPEIRLPCPDDRKAEVLAQLARFAQDSGAAIDRTDGLRVGDAEGWWLARASGTEAKLTLRCEARSSAALARITARLAQALRRAGVEPAGLG